jgi:MFS family permease
MSLSSGQTSRPRGVAAAPGNDPARDQARTDWPGVAFGLALSCYVAFQQFKLPPVLPGLLQEFHYSRALAASFMSVYALIGLLASVPLGQWLKRRGYHRGLLLGIASALLGLVLALTCARYGIALLLARALEGLTYAIFAIAGPAIATSSARLRDLPLVTGLLAGWIPVGQIGAGLLALAAPGWHTGLADWQLVWLVALALTLLLGGWCWHFSHHKNVGMAASAAKTLPPVTPDTVAAESGRAADDLVAPPASQAQTTTGPAKVGSWPQALRQRLPDLLSAGIFLLWSGQYFAFMTWLTQYLVEQHHLQPQQAVLVYLLPVVVLLVCNLLTGWALGKGLALLPALFVSLILQGLVWALNPLLDGGLGIVALLLYGICAGVIPTCLFHLPHLIAAHRQHEMTDKSAGKSATRAAVKAGPEAFATLMTGRNIGVFCGPILVPQLVAWLGSWSLAAFVIAALTWSAAALAYGLGRQLK